MPFVIMCDNTEITYIEGLGTSEAQFVLKDGVPKEYKPFGLFMNSNKESIWKVLNWFEDRAFPKERVDCEELLEELGLDRYGRWNIIKETRGTLMTDYWWLKIKPTDTYEEYSLRGAAGIPPVQVFKNKD